MFYSCYYLSTHLNYFIFSFYFFVDFFFRLFWLVFVYYGHSTFVCPVRPLMTSAYQFFFRSFHVNFCLFVWILFLARSCIYISFVAVVKDDYCCLAAVTQAHNICWLLLFICVYALTLLRVMSTIRINMSVKNPLSNSGKWVIFKIIYFYF